MLVFVSYASPDRDRITPVIQELRARGFDVWVDFLSLKAGQDWRFEIERSMDKADIILAFISSTSVARRGFVQRELKSALDRSSEKLADDIYLVPVILDENIEVPRELRHLHCISAQDANCHARIVDALNHQFDRLGRDRRERQAREGLGWERHTIRESWDGLPGYEVDIQYLDFRSEIYPQIHEATDVIKGRLLLRLLEERATRIHQMPEFCRNGAMPLSRTNTYDAHCLEPNLIGQTLSIQYRIYWYGAGAAHGNMHFETYNFVLDPMTLITNLMSIFTDAKEAPGIIRQEVRRCLYELRFPQGSGAADIRLDPEWIDKGTESFGTFDTFWFTQTGLEFLFAPYVVGSFAEGTHTVLVPYETVVPLMRKEIVVALDLY